MKDNSISHSFLNDRKDKEVNQVILKEFCKVIDFKGNHIDEALR